MGSEIGMNHAAADGVLDSVSRKAAAPVVPGEVSALISRKMVQLYRDRLGRGPTRSRTTANVNTILVAFEDTLTTAEQTLLSEGQDQHVVTMRQALADTMRDDATEMIEELVGRKVKAYVSGLDPAANVAVLVFLLDPVKETGELGVSETDLNGKVENLA